MRIPIKYLLSLITLVVIGHAEIPAQYAGDWLLVNGAVVLQVTKSGTMTLRNSGDTGPISIQSDGTFAWTLPSKPATGRFADGKLFLKNDQAGAPKWMEFLEFRKTDGSTASEVIEFALRQQTQAANAFANIRRTSQEKAILNNLRQLAAAADQFFLENGTSKVNLEQIVGPGKYIKTLSAVDGEDYSKLDLTQGVSPWKITSPNGITVSYDR